MYVLEVPGHHHASWGTDSNPEEVRHELLNNPTTYGLVLTIAIISFAILMVRIIDCLRPCIAPDDVRWEEEEDEEAQPWDLTLTADGDLLDNNGSGGRSRRYGTFYTDNGSWYNADGTEMSYHEWIEAVYDPLD
ncbi:hypothetical protein INS49_009145 [Diaporthe citri]|uniref:uncharacterized protein n=1 Tax=Diaporthe citri TaxID=83186 RepID=UPI001C80050D|nr:uncharacterized protein INS49_009145 [Diaporthe citri]KAG6364042.1 hypothetical protein INS49_009145 [Diaporthe citri]